MFAYVRASRIYGLKSTGGGLQIICAGAMGAGRRGSGVALTYVKRRL